MGEEEIRSPIMAKRVFEDAQSITVFTTTHAEAERWYKYLRKKKHIKSVEMHPYRGGHVAHGERISPAMYKYRVKVEKHKPKR